VAQLLTIILWIHDYRKDGFLNMTQVQRNILKEVEESLETNEQLKNLK
jgi:hypothetical protein